MKLLVNSNASEVSVDTKNLHFHFLDSLRGIAAVWVVLFHIYVQSESLVLPFLQSLPFLVRHYCFEVTYGVPIFFVLSGFVMAHSLKKAQYTGAYFWNFIFRRFARLTPPYYAAMAFALLFAYMDFLIRGDGFTAPSPQVILANLFYLQDILGLGHIIEVAWTLCIEMQFYIVFFILLWVSHWAEKRFQLQNAGLMIFVGTGLLAVLWLLNLGDESERARYFVPVWYCFLLGVLTYWSWMKKIPSIWLYAYLILVLAVGMVYQDGSAIASALTAALIFVAAITNNLGTWLSWQWLKFLGLVSYSLYLFHAPIISAVSFVWGKLVSTPTALSGCLAVELIVGVEIAFSGVMWWAIERPSIKWSHSLKQRFMTKLTSPEQTLQIP
jgi:peptidoglycan/LPS O-acetylase OafA/YrhL